AAGARVVAVGDVLPELGPGSGKGEALYKSVAAARGDLVVWVDADITDFGTRFVIGLLGPLLTRADVSFVKGSYDGPADAAPPGLGRGSGEGEALRKSVAAARGDLGVWVDADITAFGTRFVTGLLGPLLPRADVSCVKGYYDRPVGDDPHGGGRVTELMARPAIATLFPHLASLMQPLSGEYAGRRSLLEQLPFVQGYGVDLGLLIDIASRHGTEVLAQVDLGTRRHRNRPLDELGPQALAVLQTALRRAGTGHGGTATLMRPDSEPLVVSAAERPPLVEVPGYRRRSA